MTRNKNELLIELLESITTAAKETKVTDFATFASALEAKVNELKEPIEKKIEKYLTESKFNIQTALGLSLSDFKDKIKVKNDSGCFWIEITPAPNDYFDAIIRQHDIEKTLYKLVYGEFKAPSRLKILKP